MFVPSSDAYADPRLSPHVARISRLPHGILLHFPPLRAPVAALGLAAFGGVCAAIPAIGAAAVLAAMGFNPHGVLVMILIGGLALPFFVFGIVFVALGAYQLVNALNVQVESTGIATARKAFGITFGRRSMARAHIAAIQPQVPARFQSPFLAQPRYRLIAVSSMPGVRSAVVAEDLPGAESMEYVRVLIEQTAGIPRMEKQ